VCDFKDRINCEPTFDVLDEVRCSEKGEKIRSFMDNDHEIDAKPAVIGELLTTAVMTEEAHLQRKRGWGRTACGGRHWEVGIASWKSSLTEGRRRGR
jgi:hypothetical protein